MRKETHVSGLESPTLERGQPNQLFVGEEIGDVSPFVVFLEPHVLEVG